jgi:hypothetical protein
MPLLRVAVVLLALGVSTAAAAKDVCLLDSGNEAGFVLKKLKIPKKPGDAVPVSGFGLTSTSASSLPLSGTLIRDLDGDLLLGLTRHFQRCLLGFVLDENLNGTVSYDCNLDNVNDTVGSVTHVDCDTFFAP